MYQNIYKLYKLLCLGSRSLEIITCVPVSTNLINSEEYYFLEYNFVEFIEILHITQRYIPEDSALPSHRCKNLKSNKLYSSYLLKFNAK
jgi:hypothetical protein